MLGSYTRFIQFSLGALPSHRRGRVFESPIAHQSFQVDSPKRYSGSLVGIDLEPTSCVHKRSGFEHVSNSYKLASRALVIGATASQWRSGAVR